MFTLMYPPKIIFGRGVLSKLGEEASSLGEKALLVTGRQAMRKAGILDRVIQLLLSEGVSTSLFDEVEHDPSLETVSKGIERAKKEKVSLVIGLGGGSTIDAAKAIACLALREGEVEEYQAGKAIEGPGLPFVAVPTTAGTGAEITNNSVLTNLRKKIKKSIRSPFMIAKVALIDPELTLFCPPWLTAYSGMDALTQAVESFISRVSNPATDTLALQAIEILFFNLPLAVDRGEDIEVREKVTLGSMLSAMAFSNSGLGAVHGLAHPLGAHYGIPHGLACAILLPWVLEYNLEVRREKIGKIAERIGVKRAEDVPQAMKKLLEKVNIPPRLKEWKIEEEDIPALVKESRGSSMSKNPRDLTNEELSNILRRVI
jgi:alcohol dehydrogenase class IV